MKTPLVLIGGGGHCKSCIDVIESEGIYTIKGVLDAAKEGNVLGYPVMGNDGLISGLIKENFHFLITIGQIKTASVREKLFQNLMLSNAQLATVVSPLARVSKYAKLGKGTIVMHGAQVNASAIVGDNCIINSGALIEHDAKIGDHVHVSTHAVVNGDVKVGSKCFIGSNAVLAQGISICAESIVGAGAVVLKNIHQAGIYAGNPAHKIK